jgi:hypothetical protein
MNTAPTCAAPGCNNPVPRRPGRAGRPPIYCSPACRPSYVRPVPAVEVDQQDSTDDEQTGRDWVVRIRRGELFVVAGRGLGRFSAVALATELRSLMEGTGHIVTLTADRPRRQPSERADQNGDAIE